MVRNGKAYPSKRPRIIGFAKSRMSWRRNRLLKHLLSAPPRLRANKFNGSLIHEILANGPLRSKHKRKGRPACADLPDLHSVTDPRAGWRKSYWPEPGP